MDKVFLLIGALAAGLGVTMGAFGAHGLRTRLTVEMLAVFETGVRYHVYHALALLATALLLGRPEFQASRLIVASGWLFVGGILLFSGSLYLLAVTGIRPLGAITPIGGVAFLIAWALLAIAAIR